jgi:hypothetical protein
MKEEGRNDYMKGKRKEGLYQEEGRKRGLYQGRKDYIVIY